MDIQFAKKKDMADAFTKNKHLLWRAGFGIRAADVELLPKTAPKDLWQKLQLDSQKFVPINIVAQNIDYANFKNAGPEKRRELQKQSRTANNRINLEWLQHCITSEAQLREKMAFFWHGHFATRLLNSQYNENLLNTIRGNALGKFGDLLVAVSKSPAMLSFLNNQQNKKDHPNENFAREVMELFTMGRGHYTEHDIREGARAFTGWSFDKDGHFVFRKNQHDEGTKTFLGETGNFDGDDILKIILKQNATARFITAKIYRFFVNEKPDPSIIDMLSEKFYASGYDISELLNEIFSSDWFYDPKNIGAKIKSPIELIVGIQRFCLLPWRNRKASWHFRICWGKRC